MAGKIVTQNGVFKGLMPSFADKLSDAEIVAVLGYALANFNDVKTPVVTSEAVAAARKAAPSPTDTRHAREAALGKS
jgi:mono/diheme cytochrome c family protein